MTAWSHVCYLTSLSLKWLICNVKIKIAPSSEVFVKINEMMDEKSLVGSSISVSAQINIRYYFLKILSHFVLSFNLSWHSCKADIRAYWISSCCHIFTSFQQDVIKRVTTLKLGRPGLELWVHDLLYDSWPLVALNVPKPQFSHL